MIKLKNLISEAYVWDRKFGEPLPTLKTIMDKVEEGPDEQRPADKEVQRIVKAEAKLRERMIKLEQIFLRDARPENVKLSKDLSVLNKVLEKLFYSVLMHKLKF